MGTITAGDKNPVIEVHKSEGFKIYSVKGLGADKVIMIIISIHLNWIQKRPFNLLFGLKRLKLVPISILVEVKKYLLI